MISRTLYVAVGFYFAVGVIRGWVSRFIMVISRIIVILDVRFAEASFPARAGFRHYDISERPECDLTNPLSGTRLSCRRLISWPSSPRPSIQQVEGGRRLCLPSHFPGELRHLIVSKSPI